MRNFARKETVADFSDEKRKAVDRAVSLEHNRHPHATEGALARTEGENNPH